MLFNKFGFKLDIQANLKITDYLDVTFNLYNGMVSSFRKIDHYPRYIQGAHNKFPVFFRMVSFIDSIHMKLSSPSK